MSKATTLFEYDHVIMSAVVAGFYYNYGKRQATCRHTSCGFEPLPWGQKCRYLQYAKYENDPNNVWYGDKYKRHKAMGCVEFWCVDNMGKAPKSIPMPKSVKCKKTYFRKYTTQELADPKTKVELVALQLDIAEYARSPYVGIVAVYDLLNDKWHNNKWWTLTPKGDIAPYVNYSPGDPKNIHGIDDVLAKVKAGL